MSIETPTVPTNGGVRFEELDITPELAQEWLDREPPRQRRIMDARARTYAEEIRAGTFVQGVPEPIMLAREEDGGWVMNGRHRLKAIADTGVTLRLWVAYNCDPATFDVIDSGAPRTAANVLEADGIPHGTDLQAIARLIHCWRRAAAEFTSKPPKTRVITLALAFNDELQPLIPIGRKAARQTAFRGKAMMSGSIATFCALLEGDGGTFISRLAGYNEDELWDHNADAVDALRKALERRSRGSVPVTKRIAITLFIVAKNADVDGKPIGPDDLKYKSGEAFPTPHWQVPSTLRWGVEGDDDE
jgi:hypothetical protein